MDYKKEIKKECPQLTDKAIQLLCDYVMLQISKSTKVTEMCSSTEKRHYGDVDIFTPSDAEDENNY